MADDAARQGHQGIGDHQAQDLHRAPVLGQGGDKIRIVAHGPQQQAGLCLEIQVQQQLDDYRQYQGDHQLAAHEGHVAQNRHYRRGGENGVRPPVHRQVGTGDLEVDGEQSGHGDDAGQEIAHPQAYMDHAGEQTCQGAHSHGSHQSQPGVHASCQQDGGDCCAQGERAVHPQVGEVQNGIGDIDAEGNQRVNQALGQGADQQVRHGNASSNLMVHAGGGAAGRITPQPWLP